MSTNPIPQYLLDLPKQIKIGCFDIKIQLEDELDIEGKHALGTWEADEQLICICTKMPNRKFATSIVFHEIMHALHWYFGTEEPMSEEMAVVTSAAIYQVLVMNPDLLNWILEGIINADQGIPRRTDARNSGVQLPGVQKSGGKATSAGLFRVQPSRTGHRTP